MGLPVSFVSDAIPYGIPTAGYTEQWATLYDAPILRSDGVYMPQACVYSVRNPGASSNFGGVPFAGESLIAVVGVTVSHAGGLGSGDVGHWLIDPLTGAVVLRRIYTGLASLLFTVHGLTAEPGHNDPGRVWRWSDGGSSANYYAQRVAENVADGELSGQLPTSLNANAAYGNIVITDPGNRWPWPFYNQSLYITGADFGFASGRIQDFAIDQRNDRVWARDTRTRTVGEIGCYRLSDFSLLHTIYCPNASQQIIPTGDGNVWLVDSYGHIFLYDYDGNLLGWCREPPPAPTGGYCYGWDEAYKRLLRLEITADVGGLSTAKVYGLLPTPDIYHLSSPILRKHPRVGRRSYFWTHLCGAGGEPIGARQGYLGVSVPLNLLADSKISDGDGDFVMSTTPASSGAQAVEFFVPAVSTRVARSSESAQLPQAEVNAWSHAGFSATGSFTIETSNGTETITYTGLGTTTGAGFSGCSGGTGTIVQGARICQL